MMIEEEPEIINTQNYKNNEKAIKPQQNYYINATYKKTALLFDCYLWHVCQNGSDVIGKQIKFRFTKIHFGRSKFCKKKYKKKCTSDSRTINANRRITQLFISGSEDMQQLCRNFSAVSSRVIVYFCYYFCCSFHNFNSILFSIFLFE